MISFHLPAPPSVNHFKSIGRDGKRYSNGKYKEWKEAAGWELVSQRMIQPMACISGDVAVEIVFARNGDLDNRIKPLLDLLQAMKVIDNDNQVVMLTARFGASAGRCRVTIAPANFEVDDDAAEAHSVSQTGTLHT